MFLTRYIVIFKKVPNEHLFALTEEHMTVKSVYESAEAGEGAEALRRLRNKLAEMFEIARKPVNRLRTAILAREMLSQGSVQSLFNSDDRKECRAGGSCWARDL